MGGASRGSWASFIWVQFDSGFCMWSPCHDETLNSSLTYLNIGRPPCSRCRPRILRHLCKLQIWAKARERRGRRRDSGNAGNHVINTYQRLAGGSKWTPSMITTPKTPPNNTKIHAYKRVLEFEHFAVRCLKQFVTATYLLCS